MEGLVQILEISSYIAGIVSAFIAIKVYYRLGR
jgi:hypothetical protein